MRLRVYTSADQSSPFTELAAACCTGLLDGPTLDVALTAGQSYYYELIVHEFGGGDHAGISVILPNDTTNSPMSQYIAVAFDPASIQNIGISQQPQTQTIAANHAATFSVTVTNFTGAISYQWQVNTGSGFVDIAGANARTYTTALQPLANNGHQYRVIVTVPGKSITSNTATLNVVNDTQPPQVVAVRGSRGLNAIRITFDEAVDGNSALENSNYTLTDTNGTQLTLGTPTLSADLRTVTIPTSAQNIGAFYTLHAENVGDLAGNPMDTTNVTFQTWILSPGFVLFEAYDTGGGNAVADLRNHPSFPNSPRDVAYLSSFDSRGAYPDDSHEGYGGRISGYFIAPVTTNYIFYLRSDDASELDMNTNAVNSTDPAGAVKIQEETSCCRAFSVLPATNSLTGGQAYYIETLWKEGTGGDFAQVAVKQQGDPTNPDTLSPIPGSFLATLADPVGASVTITQQPANVLFVPGGAPLFSDTFNASGGSFTVDTPLPFAGAWAYDAARGSWHEDGQAADNSQQNISMLNSPVINVTAAGTVVLTFTHRWSFEHDGTAWDGGQVRISVNGGAFTTLPGSAFTQTPYNGAVANNGAAGLAGQQAFVSQSPGYATGYVVSRAGLGTFNPGDTIRVQFIAASDTNTRGAVPNWEIDDIVMTQGNGAAGATFTVGTSATTATSANPPRFYQWFRNNGSGFVAIPGANSASYTLVPSAGDSGAQFRVVVYVPGTSATSATATLTVGGARPTLRYSRSGGNIILSWDAPARLECSTSLTSPNWKAVTTTGTTSYTVTPSNEFNVTLETAQEPPPRGTGSGSGTVTLSNNVLVVDVAYSGLSGTRNNSHFHAPAPRGQNTNVVYNLAALDSATGQGVSAGTIKGTVPLVNGQYAGKTIAQQIQDIRNGQWYLNVHSTTFPGGEIRGQVDPGVRFYRLVTP